MSEPTRRLSGTIATLNRSKRNTGTDVGDWQTVTTERPLEQSNSRADALFNGATSSVADVSDVSWQHFCQGDHGSTDRIVQHPFADVPLEHGWPYGDNLTNGDAMHHNHLDPYAAGPLPHSTRDLPTPTSAAAAAIRMFSNAFKRDSIEKPSPRFIEMDNFGHSYESLSSEQTPQNRDVVISPWESNDFRWSRIQNNLGRDPPKAPLTVFDRPLYRPEMSAASEAPHVPHDEFLNEIPRLPFPLISLPEAAMLQRFRIERGENHTETGGSFTAKSRSCTVSTVSSQSPWTPVSPDFGRQSAYSAYVPKPPAPVYQGSRPNECRSFRLRKFPPS